MEVSSRSTEVSAEVDLPEVVLILFCFEVLDLSTTFFFLFLSLETRRCRANGCMHNYRMIKVN